jgi:phospholipid N-methyltransferase
MDDNVTAPVAAEAADLLGSEVELHTSDDTGSFIRGWVRDPRATGALLPSGRALARLMASDVGVADRVVELGAGTGTVTDAILRRGVRAQHLTLIERNAEFTAILERRFPQCRVVRADALSFAEQMEGVATFDCVVSGLPLLLFSTDDKARLLEQVLSILRPRGRLLQFTYAGFCPIGRDLRRRFGLRAALIGVAARNLPPAFVYRLERRR